MFVFLTQEDGRLYPDTDYVSLLPKESRIIQTEGKGALAAEGLNVPYRRAEESRK